MPYHLNLRHPSYSLYTSIFSQRERETQRETERDRERQRETERDRERQRETERDRERQRQTERDRDRQRQTETDNREEKSYCVDRPLAERLAAGVELVTFEYLYLRLCAIGSDIFS